MERLERLVVHVEEALRLARQPDDAHQRLALLLLDSAAELLLHRACENKRVFEHVERHLLDSYQETVEAGRALPEDDAARMRELEQRLPTPKQAAKINRYFDEKAKYLQRNGLLDPAQVRALNKLHRYRNEAYHADELREGSLRSAVRIYANLVCTLLADLPTQGLMISMKPLPASLRAYGSHPSFDFQRVVSTELLKRPEVADADDLGAALAVHLSDRLVGVDEGLDEAVASLHAEPDDPWDRAAILALVQLKDSPEHLLSTPTELRAASIPVDLNVLRKMRRKAASLVDEPDSLAAFTVFADVEDVLEPVEADLHSLLMYIDREVQQEIDRRRGK